MKYINEENALVIKSWCENPEDGAIEQAKNLAKLPFAFKQICLLPDTHQGYGMPIGGVLATKNVVIPNAVGVDIGCFSGDTKISLLDGSQKTLKQLTEKGEDIWIYSLDNNFNIVPGRATPKKTRTNTKLLKVVISGGEEIFCTSDHKFMLLNGEYKEARDLKIKESLMPFYRSFETADGYESIRAIRGKSVSTHKMVAQYFYGERKEDEVIHHKNHKWYDNTPENLEYKNARQHSSDHNSIDPHFRKKEFKLNRLIKLNENGFYDKKFKEKKIKIALENLKVVNENKEKYAEVFKKNGLRGAAHFKENKDNELWAQKRRLAKILKIVNHIVKITSLSDISEEKYNENRTIVYNGPIYSTALKVINEYGYSSFKDFILNYNNHKVLHVEETNRVEDVYCLTVEKYHNFALSSGIFVHNCGMCAVKTSISNIFLPDLKNILGQIRNRIPVGFNHNKEKAAAHLFPSRSVDLPIVDREFQKAQYQLGSLGGGNHFLEIQKGNDGFIWIMIHSGSRNLGKQVADHYNKIAVDLNEKWHSRVPKEWDLAFLPLDTDEGQLYLAEMEYCVDFALANRQEMMYRIREIFIKVLPDTFFEPIINIAHNYARMENHFGQNVMVHRKGATSAKDGEIGIIPGSQGSSSYIVRGKGNPDSFQSCSHGAGRKMGRKEAERTLNLAEEQKKLDDKGILHAIRGVGDLDEAEGAYKPIEVVMEEQKDLVDILVKLEPLAVIKG